MAEKTLDKFTLQQQEEDVWCWAAVGVSCALFYNPNSDWTQCKMVNLTSPPKLGACCNGSDRPSDCVVQGPLDNKKHVGSLDTANIANGFVENAIPFDQLKAEIDAGRVVPFMVSIDGYTHFVVVAAYKQTAEVNEVTVNDPLLGDSTMEYAVFAKHYKINGFVKYTYFTKPPQTV